ncbi:peptidoglycan DD-metalloendopeptidase family protein [Flavobacterium sp. Sd200]|uniref:M23 family metallopeptidase n=1 Tax=Flavobacterium sp. Sd200 TaxID=2692211 RepID=UPI00136891AA|nr:M23 family metallopeptidase [Flavobacterium sp. Sd200]MXN91843.1 peptidoglycan DD-metalloendopeptidase family protein [Flavobacterium sp. Sd200]
MRFCILFVLFSVTLWAQNPYPQDYFRSPMDIPIHPSGTFGELRTNHFHAGLDFRTNQKEGLPVYAAAAGYVSRIKVSSYGYGTALYIDHPNGFTTLYGHLSAYAPKIEAYVRAKQYEKKSFEIEMFPKPGEITVTQGELIALSGNSGGSGGPHLHFEYRDTKTEMIINPLLFGLNKKMKDTKPPTIHGIMVYPLSDDAVVNESRTPTIINLKLQPDGTYIADRVYAKGKIGFGISATDKSTGSMGNNGIYKAETFFNGSPHFSYAFSSFAFDESRYINNFIDYQRYYSTGQRYQKLFVRTPYPLSLLKHNSRNGQYNVTPDTLQNFRIEIYDFHGNNAIVNGTIQYSDKPSVVNPPKHVTPYFVKAANDNNYSKNNVSVFIPANAFYEDFYMDFDVKDSVLHLHNPTVPVHTAVTVSFDVNGIPKDQLQKTFIAGFTNKRINYNDSYIEDGRLTAKVKLLGNYKLAQDVTPPKIYSPSFAEGKWLTAYDRISFKISDDLSGIATYDAWLNGKWILMHYDYKTRLIYHNFSDGVVSEGRNDLKITVTDNVGNSTTFETHFFRTQNTTSVENNK